MPRCHALHILQFCVVLVLCSCIDKSEISTDTGGDSAETTFSAGETTGGVGTTGSGSETSSPETTDLDGDGHGVADGDCDDTDPSIYPGAPEFLLTHDTNCDGEVGNRLSLADYRFIGELWDAAGCSVSGAGDVDADGLDDILVGALGGSSDTQSGVGRAYLVLGRSLTSPSSTIELADVGYTFVGESGTLFSGSSVSAAGDVDGDGLDDILIGAPLNDDGGENAGKAYLVLGGSLGDASTIDLVDVDHYFIGSRPSEQVGDSVAGAGDVDGDGLGDILIGAYANDDGGSWAGKAYLLLSSDLGAITHLTDASYSFIGENSEDFAGNDVSGAGDVDGDGRGDFLIGAFGNDDGGSSAGMTYLIRGGELGATHTTALSSADFRFEGEHSYETAGSSVANAGDVDNDGLDDVLIGAAEWEDSNSTGLAYLLLSHL